MHPFRFKSDGGGTLDYATKGFQIVYNVLEFDTDCGGSYTNASALLSSPSYPNPYPILTDCVYLISQPKGTYINISFITINIDCQGMQSDFIEIKDGNTEESPLMEKFCKYSTNFIATTQNHVMIRYIVKLFKRGIVSCTLNGFFIFRFRSHEIGGGVGFQLRYDSIHGDPQITYRIGECGGNFTTPSGFLSSPIYPNYYPPNADCIYTMSQSNGTVIWLNFLNVDVEYTENTSTCKDYLEVRDGPSEDSNMLEKICGNKIPPPIQSSQNQLWMRREQIL